MQVLKVTVKPKIDRLDQFVSDQIKSLSRSKAKKLINDGYILVNNHPSDPSYKVGKGDTVKVDVPVSVSVSLKPEKIPLKIIYEDKDIIVIDKQAGLVVHPTLDHPSGTVVNALINHLEKDETLRPGIVHRLDKNTSGLLVIGKTQIATENLKKQFKDRSVTKEYIALVGGLVEKEIGIIDQKIDRHPKFRTKFIVADEGREAKTEYKVVERFKNCTLVKLKPFTGRTHQLRVHLSWLGHPIIGDKLYGGKMLINRQFLHACFLSFKQPETGVELKFESNLPEELENLLTKIRN